MGWTVKKEKSFKRGLPKDKDKNEGFSGVWPNILVWVLDYANSYFCVAAEQSRPPLD